MQSMRIFTVGVFILLNGLPLIMNTAGAQDIERGRLLYENHCLACHESQVYIREKRRTRSVEEIHRWVVRWSSELQLGWDAGEVNDVADYLNFRFYKFGLPKDGT